MVVEVTRYVKKEVERDLWARAAGRCEFDGCNRILYRSSVTQESVNLAQKAHIYSFSEKGPRGWGPFSLTKKGLNDIGNLMLMCPDCHIKIDQDNSGKLYSAELLISWKHNHELRVETVTGIEVDKKSHVVCYGANIGSEKSPINFYECVKAMFPQWYPASERPVVLSMNSTLKDKWDEYWIAEKAHLIKSFDRFVGASIDQDDCKHYSIFALAPQPLLILLGALLTDKISVETYQLKREPKEWVWLEAPESFRFIVNKPNSNNGAPVLLLSLSDHVCKERITRVIDGKVSVWEVTVETPNNDFLRSRAQLSEFRKLMRQVIVEIKKSHGNMTPLHVFPVMPVSCAVEFGRIRMPKADMPWIIYDQHIGDNEFVKAIELEGDLHD